MPASKFTAAYRKRLFANLKTGMPLEPACAGAGIGLRTMKDWRDKGEAALAKQAEGGKLTPKEQAFVAFFDDLADAIALGHYETYMWWLGEAKKMPMKGNWQAPERMLERRFRDDYRIGLGRAAGLTVAADGDGKVEIKLSFEPDEKLADDLREK